METCLIITSTYEVCEGIYRFDFQSVNPILRRSSFRFLVAQTAFTSINFIARFSQYNFCYINIYHQVYNYI